MHTFKVDQSQVLTNGPGCIEQDEKLYRATERDLIEMNRLLSSLIRRWNPVAYGVPFEEAYGVARTPNGYQIL